MNPIGCLARYSSMRLTRPPGTLSFGTPTASPRARSGCAPDCAMVSRMESSIGRAHHQFAPSSTMRTGVGETMPALAEITARRRSEEHTSELQSRGHLVCRLLLEKKKKHQPE